MTDEHKCRHCGDEWSEGGASAHVCTLNRFGVAATGDKLVLLFPLPPRLSREDALLLAAYLVCLMDQTEDHAGFHRVLTAVENT